METYDIKGFYSQGPVYVLKTLEDWDEYEKICKEKDPEFLKWNPNFYTIKEEFKKYIGKIWEDKAQLRYMFNGNPVYEKYKVIAIEDNSPMLDWYWHIQNIRNLKDIKHLLVNSPDLKNGLK